MTPNVALALEAEAIDALKPEYEAINVTEVAELTVPAVTEKLLEVRPAYTLTVAGTVTAAVLELESDTITPPLGATEANVTVPVAEPPLLMVPGLTERLSAGGSGTTVRPKVLFTLE